MRHRLRLSLLTGLLAPLGPAMRRRQTLVGITAAAILGALLLLTTTSLGVPWPASGAASASTGGPEMVLNVKGGECDDPIRPTTCNVGFGTPFHIGVHALGIPANGYILMQTFIDYGPDLIYKPANPLLDEMFWPDNHDDATFIVEPGPGLLSHAALTSVFPPQPQSTYVGKVVAVSMNCPDTSTTTTVNLLPFNDPVAGTFGSVFTEFGTEIQTIPKVGSLTINCVVAPTPENCPGGCATPTAKVPPTPCPGTCPTPTSTPTPTPCPPGTCPKMILNIKGGNCDDALEPTTCAVVVGNTFMLSVDAIRIPPDGYRLMQTHIDYGPNLTYKEQPTLVEIVWPDISAPSAASGSGGLGPHQVAHVAWTGFTPPILVSTFVGNLVEMQMTCPPDPSANDVQLLAWGDAAAGAFGSVFLDPDSNEVVPAVGSLTIDCVPPPTPTPTPTATPTMQPKPGDTDGDGCPDAHENGSDETQGGQRNYKDPNDYYDVYGPGQSLTHDGVIDLPNDILGVIQHFAPTGAPPYDLRFDRGVTIGANHWQRAAPDGVIDLPNDILGVIQQFQHNCQ